MRFDFSPSDRRDGRDGLGAAAAPRLAWLPIGAAHALALWALAQSMDLPIPRPSVPPLWVSLLADAPAPRVPAPAPARAAPTRTPPPPVWMPVPEVTSAAPAPAPTTLAATPTPPAAPSISPSISPDATTEPAASAPVASRPPPVERQIAITQVAYLTPPLLDYPLASRRAREEGVVQVRVRVDAQGRPDQVAVLRSSGHVRLDQAALATVRATRFRPYTEDGQPRPFWVVMPLVFELDI